MRISFQNSRILAAAGLASLASQAYAASSFVIGDQFILESDNADPAHNGSSQFKISVHDAYAGYYGETGTSTDPIPVEGTFNGTVSAYRFWYSDSSSTFATHTQSGGIINDIVTTDDALVNWGAANIWETTNPNYPAWDTAPDFNLNLSSLDQGATGTVDITGLSAGSLYIIYGAFRSTPSLSANMTGSVALGEGGDINIAQLHANGDKANNNEYYIARLDFVNEDGYTTLDWVMDAGFSGRLSGLVVTTPITEPTVTIPEPGVAFLLGYGAICLLLRRPKPSR